MKILNYGSLNYDYTYQVDHMVRPGETLASQSLTIHCGGKGLNQSIALARAGLQVFHAGMVGEDGEDLIAECVRNKIDISHIRRTGKKSGHAIIQVNRQGENSILLYEGANGTNTTNQIETVFREFGEGDWLLVQNEINLLDQIIETAYKKGMKVILNPSPFHEKILDCHLEHVSMFLLNETEGQQISEEQEPEKILQKLNQRYPSAQMILTMGKEGVFYSDGKEQYFVPAFCVNAVDTTAAGDTFTGYYLASLFQGKTIESALRTACAASALAVMKEGAAASIPVPEEVLQFLEKEGCRM